MEEKESRKAEAHKEEEKEEKKGICLPIGPQHPMYVEAENLMVDVEGETITDVEVNIGYMHRGIEELMQKRNFNQNIFLAQRICGICSGCHSVCYTMAIENLMGVQVPKRADYIRTVILELERLHSHLLFLGVMGYEMGLDTLFMLSWKDREFIQDILETISGNRVNYDMLCVGGVRRDVPVALIPKFLKDLKYIRKRADYYNGVFLKDRIIRKRSEGLGILTKKQSKDLCLVGPPARASGDRLDIRKARPYLVYDDVEWHAITKQAGDVQARVLVKVLELTQSVKILEQCFKRLRAIKGPIRNPAPKTAQDGDGIGFVEAPRGELFYYSRGNGTERPERIKMRTPSFMILPNCLKPALVGQRLADLPVIVASFDPCFSCCDRITVLSEKGKKTYSEQDFRRLIKC